jgi:hypothetical protein
MVVVCFMVLNATFNNIMAVSLIGGGNRSKPPTSSKYANKWQSPDPESTQFHGM